MRLSSMVIGGWGEWGGWGGWGGGERGGMLPQWFCHCVTDPHAGCGSPNMSYLSPRKTSKSN